MTTIETVEPAMTNRTRVGVPRPDRELLTHWFPKLGWVAEVLPSARRTTFRASEEEARKAARSRQWERVA